MRAIIQKSPGGPDTLEWGHAPDPEPKQDEILIKVFATAFNPADAVIREGVYLTTNQAPEILGLECAGIVQQVGAAVSGWNVGDRVCALIDLGGYAELVAVPASMVFPLPDHLSFAEGATLPESLCTFWSNRLLGPTPSAGQTTLVHGGTGGVGSIAIQVAKSLGDKVFTTVGTNDGVKFTQSLGADLSINYNVKDFVEEVLRFTEKTGVDFILDTQGAPYFHRNIAALKSDGHLALIGVQGGSELQIDILELLRKRVIVTATTLRSRRVYGAHSKSHIVRQVKSDLWQYVVSGKILPVIGAVRPIRDAPAVHFEHTKTELPPGKTVLQIAKEN